MRRFLRQELGGVQGDDGGSNRTAANLGARLRDDQLLLFLGGPGGTEKSRVIDAFYAFCLSWHRDDSVVKATLTGKAATLIGGRTLASFLMRIKHAIKEKRFGPIDLLVIDEVSMMAKSDFLRLDKLLRRYTQVLDIPFGGVHVVLVGDFLQMPPVNADPIYIDPSDKTTASTEDIEGFDLWLKFSTVVMLQESVRFRRDPEWGEGCRLARLGQWTPAFIALVISRVIEQPHGQEEESDAEKELERERQWATQPQPTQTLRAQIAHDSVFVTPENATRLAVNNAFVAETALILPSDAHPVRVAAKFKGALNGLSRSDIRYVLSLPDNKFGRVAPYLALIDGMPVQVTQNVATTKGVANGTLGALEHVQFPAGSTFRLVRDGASNMVVWLPDRPSEYAILRVPRPHAVAIRAGVDPELFPVFLATEPYARVTISLPRAPNGQRRSITVRPQQLPFVCAVGSTVYKVQGETTPPDSHKRPATPRSRPRTAAERSCTAIYMLPCFSQDRQMTVRGQLASMLVARRLKATARPPPAASKPALVLDWEPRHANSPRTRRPPCSRTGGKDAHNAARRHCPAPASMRARSVARRRAIPRCDARPSRQPQRIARSVATCNAKAKHVVQLHEYKSLP